MLKNRVIPVLLVRDINLIKGEQFNSWRAVGSPLQAVKVFNRRDVDELVILDIQATPAARGPDLDLVADLAAACFVPLTVGGGITDVETIRLLLKAGADKVAINSAAYHDPDLISRAADRFGAQCVVAAIDFKPRPGGGWDCFSQCGTKATGIDLVERARELERLGAGEILLTAIERDGMMSGYDLDAVAAVAREVGVPVIAAGGAGSYDDMARVIADAGASAAAAGSIYLFTQATPLEAKAVLSAAGIPVRKHLTN